MAQVAKQGYTFMSIGAIGVIHTLTDEMMCVNTK